jgi:hypothetical protein
LAQIGASWLFFAPTGGGIVRKMQHAARATMREAIQQECTDVRFRREGPLFSDVENWRRGQRKIPSRPQAIRELLKRALGRADQQAEAAR